MANPLSNGAMFFPSDFFLNVLQTAFLFKGDFQSYVNKIIVDKSHHIIKPHMTYDMDLERTKRDDVDEHSC